MVGISGAAGERFAEVTAIGRNLPDLMNGIAEGIVGKMSDTCPPITSANAGALPLYGTCTMSIFAIILKSSPARCGGVPLPADA